MVAVRVISDPNHASVVEVASGAAFEFPSGTCWQHPLAWASSGNVGEQKRIYPDDVEECGEAVAVQSCRDS